MNSIAYHSEKVDRAISIRSKISDYQQLMKIRLTTLVVFSAVITYITANSGFPINWFNVFILALG